MKMGTILSPWRYDAAARHTLQSVNLRRPTPFALRFKGSCLPRRVVVRLPFDGGSLDQSRIDVMGHVRTLPQVRIRHTMVP